MLQRVASAKMTFFSEPGKAKGYDNCDLCHAVHNRNAGIAYGCWHAPKCTNVVKNIHQLQPAWDLMWKFRPGSLCTLAEPQMVHVHGLG